MAHVKESEKNWILYVDPHKVSEDLLWAKTHPPSKFHWNLFCNFTEKPTNKQTDMGDSLTSQIHFV